MIRFRAAAAGLLLGAAAAHAAETLTVNPPLDQALPWADTPQGVRATAPFLLNAATIVPAGAAVRVFYVRPVADASDDGPKFLDKAADKGAAYSRGGGANAQDSEVKKRLNDVDIAIRAAHQTVWPTIASFRAAFALLGSPDLRLVYQEKEGADLADQALAPVQGLILAEKDRAVVVAGVVQGSNADRAGFAAGDAVETVNGAPVNGSLATFSALYQQAASSSTISKPKPYVFGVRHAGAAAPVDLAIRPPPSLGGSLLDQ